jgi:hypothetical protein
MNPQPFQISDTQRDDLREVLIAIDRELACLALEGTQEDHRNARRGLMASWSRLEELFAWIRLPQVGERRPC